MAKRYYDSNGGVNHNSQKYNDKDRSQDDFSQGRMLRGPLTSAELYAGMEPRRRQELEDAGMIHEDHRAIANLPQEVMIKAYPATGPYLPEVLEDSIRGVDGQMDYDDAQRKAHFYPKKV